VTALLVVCGLRREAVKAAWHGVTTVVSGGSRMALERRLASIDPGAVDAVVSFGLAGGLDPSLSVGDVLLASEVCAEDRRYRVTQDFASTWMRAAARGSLPIAGTLPIAGVDAPVTTPDAKAALRERTGAAGVDMESHIAAAYAERHGLPFGVLRVVSDGADRVVPPAAAAALRDDGGVDVLAAMGSLLRQPTQIPALLRTARDGARAFEVLRHAGLLLRPDLGSDSG
jgi:hopanoid-associated phosphorylase